MSYIKNITLSLLLSLGFVTLVNATDLPKESLPINQTLNPQVQALTTKSLQEKDYLVVKSTQVNAYLKKGYHLGGLSCINTFETTTSGMIAFKGSVCLQALYKY